MKNTSTPRSRQCSTPFLDTDPVRRRRPLHGAGSTLPSCLLVLSCLLPALLGSCEREPIPGTPDDTDLPEAVDSVLTRISMQEDGYPVRKLDLFVYVSDGLRTLERHLTLESPSGELNLPTLPGEKILVGIANSPYRFNQKSLERYDSMEQLAFDFVDDDPECPVLGGMVTTREQQGQIVLKPLLCRIELAKVSNTMDDYELLEDPRVRLTDMPGAAEILRREEFRPAELIDGKWSPLPYDVGYFPQTPGITLWCYPNDTPETVLGVPRPTLEFACRIRGTEQVFEVPLPPLPRGSSVQVELIVDGPGSFSFKLH